MQFFVQYRQTLSKYATIFALKESVGLEDHTEITLHCFIMREGNDTPKNIVQLLEMHFGPLNINNKIFTCKQKNGNTIVLESDWIHYTKNRNSSNHHHHLFGQQNIKVKQPFKLTLKFYLTEVAHIFQNFNNIKKSILNVQRYASRIDDKWTKYFPNHINTIKNKCLAFTSEMVNLSHTHIDTDKVTHAFLGYITNGDNNENMLYIFVNTHIYIWNTTTTTTAAIVNKPVRDFQLEFV